MQEFQNHLRYEAEALAERGTALARLGRYEEARAALWLAVEAAERDGARECAGLAALAVIEELGARLSVAELRAFYERADQLLGPAPRPQALARLRRAAALVIERARALAVADDDDESDDDVTDAPWPSADEDAARSQPGAAEAEASTQARVRLGEEVRRYEAELIEMALGASQGQVTRAARLLGISHQRLSALLKRRHKGLLHARKPYVSRKPAAAQPAKGVPRATGRASAVVLHLEDDPVVAETTKEILELEGWRVESCSDGAAALERLSGAGHYDLLLADYEVPRVDGLEVVRRARRLVHRRQLPVVVFSASDCVTEAHRAGANLFLRKPHDIHVLAETVSRLLAIYED